MMLAMMFAIVTAGWENANPSRREIVEEGRLVWSADFSRHAGFTFEKRGGAEGDVRFGDGSVTVRKTNGRGYLVLKAAAFAAETNAPLRAFGDVEVTSGDYCNAHVFLRCHGAKESFKPCYELATKNFSMGGAEEMWGAVNCAPGTTYRKFAHARARDGVVTPMLVMTGEPSSVVLRRWAVEDLEDATRKWNQVYEAKHVRDHSPKRMDEAEFDRLVAADPVDHTAKVGKVGGITRFLIDGEVAVPTAYRAKTPFGADAMFETMAGGAVVRRGMRIVVKTVQMGAGRKASSRHFWTPSGFDAHGAVGEVKNSLRIVPDALYILGISCNAYPDFTLKEHPESIWLRKDGKPVLGTSGSCLSDYHDMGVADTNVWPWVSYAAPAWRQAVKDNIGKLVDELRRQGLLKRIVGVHLSGYHDGQFYSPFPDYSSAAKAEYARYLKEKRHETMDFETFSKTLGFRAQEDFARAFKRALGKDSVAIRWCMGPFAGAFDLTAFANSDALDICVPQPGYQIRRPGMATEAKLPFSSFDLHGKMFWYEFDLRTYGALESWAIPGVVSTKGLGQSDDIKMWRTVLRKHAGVQMARNCGFWFYDMGGGFYSPPEIADEIGSVLRDYGALLKRPRTPWKPGVALIADEFGLSAADGEAWNGGSRNPYASQLLRRQMTLLAASGVPYDLYLADDVLRDPSLAKDYRMLVFGLFRNLDEPRARLLRTLATDGRMQVYLAETGVHGDASATGFEVSYTTNACPHDMVAERGVPPEFARSDIRARSLAHFPYQGILSHAPRGPRCSVRETEGTKVLARYVGDGAPAIARRQDANATRVYVAEPSGLSAPLFNSLAREAGAYVPVEGGGVQVDINADFASLHALRNGTFRLRLPRACPVFNMKSRRRENARDGFVDVTMTAGETCWFLFED